MSYDRPATIAESVQEYVLNAAHPDDDLCACRGGGWTLSSWDTWHKCPAHFNGQDHPEYDPEVMGGDGGTWVLSGDSYDLHEDGCNCDRCYDDTMVGSRLDNDDDDGVPF